MALARIGSASLRRIARAQPSLTPFSAPIGNRFCSGSGNAHPDSLIDCSKVYVKKDQWGGAGAFAAEAIKKGELVERGIVRRLPVDGNESQYVFTWSEGDSRDVWASGSGCSVFYNANIDGGENTEMHRYIAEDKFEIFAIKDIEKDEELTHLYKSIEWRNCFKELKALRDSRMKKP
eukprot:TRINITY_DN13485_c0_g1_i1.p2 TRINITY_DN13485_c0_g1~~TRINITY_DN13485_c0_g1_i1.p2  ORF type:complete len:177 (-),score=34.11 TRINITY_DN13485_c0_g1_i1:269-799(-)